MIEVFPHLSSWQLVGLVQNGQTEAFGDLYQRYAAAIRGYTRSRIPDRATADDITSETFYRALRSIGSITQQGSDVRAWLIVIARNLVRDHYKALTRTLDVPVSEFVEISDTDEGAEQILLRRERNAQLQQRIEKLSKDQRQCVTLRFMHERSVTETASAMGRRCEAVRALQHRAIRKLEELVTEDPDVQAHPVPTPSPSDGLDNGELPLTRSGTVRSPRRPSPLHGARREIRRAPRSTWRGACTGGPSVPR